MNKSCLSKLPRIRRRQGFHRVGLSGGPQLEAMESRLMMTTIIVNTALDTVDANPLVTSLREAMLEADSVAGHDIITFNIGGGGAVTIQPGSALPLQDDVAGVTIDGTTQPGWVSGGPPLITLDGSFAGSLATASGLRLFSANNVVRGLAIHSFAQAGIQVSVSTITSQTPTNNLFENNVIGLDASGTIDLGNGTAGIDLRFGNKTIAGTENKILNNVISGNAGEGIALSQGSAFTIIEGNKIGTNSDGDAAIGNSIGIAFVSISTGPTANNTSILNNTISGNFGDGIAVGGNASPGVNGINSIIRGNYIGTNADGDDLGNGGNGVTLNTNTASTTIGGTGVGQANTIAFNLVGVRVFDGPGQTISANSIHDNDGLGIDIDLPFVAAPVITAAESDGSTTTSIDGELLGTGGTYTIEFFSNPAADGSGFGEGKVFLGSTIVSGSGTLTFSVSLGVGTTVGHVISATARDGAGNTGEFSATNTPDSVVESSTPPNSPPQITAIGGPATGVRGQTLSYSVAFTDPDTLDTHTFAWVITDSSSAIVASGTDAGISFAPIALDTYTVTVTVTDGALASDTESLNVTVSLLAVQGGALYVGGSEGNDNIRVRKTNSGELKVIVNETEYDVRTVTLVDPLTVGRAVVFGGGGDDLIKLDLDVTGVIAEFYGGAGHDKLRGGQGNDILVGGDGDDLLDGFYGRDIMIGGRGADKIVGDQDDDILVGGYTVYDDDRAALAAIAAEWNNTGNSYLVRIANLMNGTGLNGSFVLNDTTVGDDNALDILRGRQGLDWFLADEGDDKSDESPLEVLTQIEIDFLTT